MSRSQILPEIELSDALTALFIRAPGVWHSYAHWRFYTVKTIFRFVGISRRWRDFCGTNFCDTCECTVGGFCSRFEKVNYYIFKPLIFRYSSNFHYNAITLISFWQFSSVQFQLHRLYEGNVYWLFKNYSTYELSPIRNNFVGFTNCFRRSLQLNSPITNRLNPNEFAAAIRTWRLLLSSIWLRTQNRFAFYNPDNSLDCMFRLQCYLVTSCALWNHNLDAEVR